MADDDFEKGLAEWWKEDAKRHNAMGRTANRLGYGCGKATPPPELNPDGSLKDPEEKDVPDDES